MSARQYPRNSGCGKMAASLILDRPSASKKCCGAKEQDRQGLRQEMPGML
ncbi:MAG: hypothetical protein NTY19_34120 [Planctomycetota bacterium]|nr:hypothetical protein [Planctomycetota bacterium]